MIKATGGYILVTETGATYKFGPDNFHAASFDAHTAQPPAQPCACADPPSCSSCVPKPQPPAPIAGPGEYVGCFRDGVQRDMERQMETFPDENPVMTVTLCKKWCQYFDFTFAGLQFGKQCFCSNKVERPYGVAEGQCTMPCSGDKNEQCGNAWVNSVWRTNKGMLFFDNRGEYIMLSAAVFSHRRSRPSWI